MPTPPPVPAAAERRGAQRFEVVAQATVVAGEETHVLAVRNVSFGGVFLDGKPDEYPDLKRGAKLDIVLSGSEPGARDEDILNIRCTGQIVRIDPGSGPQRPPGFGVTLIPVDDDEQDRLNKLLLRLSNRR